MRGCNQLQHPCFSFRYHHWACVPALLKLLIVSKRRRRTRSLTKGCEVICLGKQWRPFYVRTLPFRGGSCCRLSAATTVNPTRQRRACVLPFCHHRFICSATASSLFLRSCSTASKLFRATTVGALVCAEMQRKLRWLCFSASLILFFPLLLPPLHRFLFSMALLNHLCIQTLLCKNMKKKKKKEKWSPLLTRCDI